MELDDRQWTALRAICDTFVPGSAPDVPGASEIGGAERLMQYVDANPREPEKRQLALLLRLWNTRPHGLLSGAGWRHFTDLDQSGREKVLLSYAQSRVPQKRVAFQKLKVGALMSYLASARADRAWAKSGYPGPSATAVDTSPASLAPLRIQQSSTLDCDVVVVGSGAGGGTAAAVLAQAGLDVVVLEAGGYHHEPDFGGDQWDGFIKLFGLAPAQTVEGMTLLRGSCLGGGTVVNLAASFRTPDNVRDEWAALGVPQFATEEYAGALDAVCARIGVNTDESLASTRDELMERGLKELGWHVDTIPRNVRGCDCGRVCGNCMFGCPLGAKQSTMKTWLRDAADAGARLVTGVAVRKVLVQGGAAVGVEGATTDGHAVTVRARSVVVAAGAIQTPALLLRSGLSNRNIGRHLRLHPHLTVFAEYDENLRPWEGAPMSRYCAEHRDLDGQGYGVTYEGEPMLPIMLPYGPWSGADGMMADLGRLNRTSPILVIVRDKGSGRVRVGRDGEPIVRYRVSGTDLDSFRAGLKGATQIAEAAGARRIWSLHTRPTVYTPGDESLQEYLARCDAAGYAPGQFQFYSAHHMGTARMGGSPESSATNPDGRVWGTRNLVVADGSCFPTASGVNPMVSIEAIAFMNATRLAATLTC